MDYTKRKHTIMLISALALVSLAFGAVAFIGTGTKDSPIYADNSPYALALGESLGLAGNTSVTALTTSGGRVTISASALSVKSGDLGELAAGGYVMNSSPVTGLKSVAIDFDEAGTVNALKVELGISKGGSIDYSIATSSSLSADGTVTVSAQTTYDVAYVKVSNPGSAVSDVKSITLTYNCTKSVTDYQKITYMVEGAAAKTEYLAKGASFASAYVPTLSGYSFNAWTDASGNAVTGTTISADMTVYPAWYHNVESDVSGVTKKAFHAFATGTDTAITVSGGSDGAFNGYSNGGGSISAPTAATAYSFTLPGVDITGGVITGAEVGFDLYSTGWGTFTLNGVELPYDNEHASGNPYHIAIKQNGVGYGVYVSSGTQGNYGELFTLDSSVANGTTGFTVSYKSDLAGRTVSFSQFSVYALDYNAVIASDLSALKSSATVATLSAYETAVVNHLTAYEKSQYSAPAEVTAAKNSLSGQSNALLTFPTQAAYFDSTSLMLKAGIALGINSNLYNAIGSSSDADYYSWVFQTTANVANAYIELPRIAYSAYSEVTFKTWFSTNGSFSVNGTQLEASTDCVNHQWCYVIKVVTDTTSTVMTVFHGNGSYGPMTQIQATYTLPSAVASGQTPFRFVKGGLTSTVDWGFSSIKGTI